jgi:hypothetical protein
MCMCNVLYMFVCVSVAGIVQLVQWLAEVSELKSWNGQDFSPLHIFRTVSGAHPASYSMGTEGSAPGGKAAGA